MVIRRVIWLDSLSANRTVRRMVHWLDSKMVVLSWEKQRDPSSDHL